nr:TonB-dependent receptor [uncultured Carboxylicivirga sp.]
MKSLNFHLLILCFWIGSSYLMASETKWTVTGVVIEQQTNEAIPNATVSIFSRIDSTLITGGITNNDGEFSIQKLVDGEYHLKISFMGYKDFIVDPLILNASEKIINLGTLRLVQDVEALSEIVVTSNNIAIKNSVDRQVINVSSNLSASGGTAIDALRLSPSLQIDPEGNVKLRGSSDFIVLVNGKPTSLQSGDVLKQIPANTISKIEVITNPSVKYNAEGGAGIINVVLKRGYQSGLNGMINASIGTKDKYAGDVTINLNKEKASYSIGLDWRDYTTTANNNYYRTLFNESNTHYASMLQDRSFTDSNLGFRFGIDYNPNENTNISYSFHTGYNKLHANILNTNSGYTIPESNEEHKYNPFYLSQKPTFFTNNIGFTKIINERNDKITANIYYSYIDYEFINNQLSYFTDENQVIIDPSPYQLNVLNNNNSNDLRLDADYTNVLSDKSDLEAGVSYHLYSRFLNLIYSEFDYNSNDWVNHPDYTNKYNFDESVYSTYLNLNSSVLGLTTSVGLRMEYTDRLLKRKGSNEEYHYNKANFFPGVSLSKNINDQSILKFALTSRINRPDEYYMNPYPEFQDDYFYSEGNPYLIPEIIRNSELGYSYNKDQTSFTSNLYYRTTKHKIEQKLTVEDDGKIHTIFHNDSGDKALGLELMGNIKVNNWWNINVNANLFYYDIWALVEEIKVKNNDFSWNTQMVNSIHFNPSTSLQVIGYYSSQTAWSQGYLSDYYFFDIAFKKQFLNNRLSINLQLKDALQSLNYELTTNTNNMKLVGDFNNESPILLFNLSYTFSNYNKKTRDVETKFDM